MKGTAITAITVEEQMDIMKNRAGMLTKMASSRRAEFAVCICGICASVALVLSGSPAYSQNADQNTLKQQEQRSIAGVPGNLENIPIASGDLLDIEVFATPELSGKVRVDQNGRVTLPLGVVVDVQGLSVSAASDAVVRQLKESQLMLNPSVSISVVQYAAAGVTILGEVRSPGVYTLLGAHSLYDAIAIAGGPSINEGADIKISHPDDPDHPISVHVSGTDYSADLKKTSISPGDTIVVSKAEVVYVVGDVVRNGSYPISAGLPLTIMQLLSLANGVNRTAALSKASIVRPAPDGSVTVINLNLDKILKVEQHDFALKGGDVLVVPRSGWKTFEYTAIPTLTSSVSSAVVAKLILQ